MRYRITFIAGLAIGYVLGAKAGRARYEQIAGTARKIARNPAVQDAASAVGSQVTSAGRAVYTKVEERLPVTSVKDFLARPTPEESEHLDQEAPAAVPPQDSRL
ncbi:hypothetical protein [Nocardiopsis composta]|uniref:YtxH domain-containing protein n=1 Tax=Nocardiopsis composta TaxID=157465 RepID=A0A7W8VDC4_9ACTN|nr:hypothetical protein [Nocardiopsis composta]MBB5432102.1 hypothetical protein [Nocardiopsis composta]